MSFSHQDYPRVSGSLPPIQREGEARLPPGEENIQRVKIGLEAYGGTDTIGSSFFTSIQFFAKPDYEALAQVPSLLAPELEGQIGPQPYGSAEQKLMRKFFSNQVSHLLSKAHLTPEETKLIYTALMKGETLKDPKLQKIAKNIEEEATTKTRLEGRLPETWTMQSTKSNDWVPQPIQPYGKEKQAEIDHNYDLAVQHFLNAYIKQAQPPLTEEQLNHLNTAITTGKVSADSAEAYTTITKRATAVTQEAFGLSPSWFKGTTQLDDWKPVYLGIVNPRSVSEAQLETVLLNEKQLLENMETIGKNILGTLPSNNPQRIALTDFLAAVGEALSQLKQTLRDIQLRESEQAKASTQAKFDLLQSRRDRAEEHAKKIQEQKEKQGKQSKFSSVMKIVGISVAVASTLIGAGLLIFTAGASLPLIIAGITVGAALMTYSIVDSFMGVTQQVIAKFNEFIEEMTPDASPLKRAIIKAIIISAFIAALAVIIAAIALSGSGASAGANIATQTVTQVAKQATLEVTKQTATQLMVLALASSNAFPELVGSILEAKGVDKKSSRFAQIAVVAVQMLAITLALVLSQKVGKTKTETAAKKIDDALQEVGKTQELAGQIKKSSDFQRAINELKVVEETTGEFKQTTKSVQQTAGVLEAIEQAELAAEKIKHASMGVQTTTSEIKEIEKTIDSEKLKQIQINLQKAAHELLEKIKEIKDLPAAVKKQVSDIILGIFQFPINIFKLGGLRGAAKVVQITPIAVDIATNVTKGIGLLEISRLLKEIGDIKASEELLQELIQMMEKFLRNLQAGMDVNNDFIQSLQRDFTNLYESTSRQSGKIMQTLQARG